MGNRCVMLIASMLSLAPLAHAAHPFESADAGASSTFSITHQTQVPGQVLKPGDYSIQIVEHISDRMIVRIDGVQGKEHVLFLGVPNFDASGESSAPGVQTWHSGAGSLPTLRGFNFPTGSAVAFVYPKAEAAALAKANAATIVAIDPESEGRPTKLKDLSSDDMREINLWMLTLTSTGPDNSKIPALEAKRYQARPSSGTDLAGASPTRTAPVSQPHPVGGSQSAPSGVQVASLDQPQALPAHTARRKPAVSELPHTASLLPVVWSIGLASFLTAAVLFVCRSSFGKATLEL